MQKLENILGLIIDGMVSMSQPAFGCIKVRCHARVLEHSMRGRYLSPSSL